MATRSCNCCGRIRATIPGVALRTSFIVGFPGETESDFRELCDFVKAAEFDWMGVFPYSDVDNASSFALDEKVDEDTIKERQSRLMEIQQKISARKLRRFRGQSRDRAGRRAVQGHASGVGSAPGRHGAGD